MPPTDDTNDLRQKLTHAEAVIAGLRGVVAELRKQIESQQAHIHRLVKITCGDGGLKTPSVLLSVCASATRQRLNPWSFLRDVFDQLAARSASEVVSDLLPDAWAARHVRTG